MAKYTPGNITTEDYQRTVSPHPLSEIDSTLFGRKGRSIVKSLDKGRNYSDWYTPTDPDIGNAISVVALNNNKVIIGYEATGGKRGFYLTEVSGGVATSKKIGDIVVDWPNIGFGYDRYPHYGQGDKIVLMSEYGLRDPLVDFPRHLHVYEESRDMFRTIFELPVQDPTNTHLHGAHYDQYNDTVWVCNGDMKTACNLWYSHNWRDDNPTWNQVWTTGTAPVQFTSIFATETQILLGSDGVGIDGLYALDRNPQETYRNPILKDVLILGARDALDVARGFMTTRNNEIYVAFSSKGTHPSSILGSKNGIDWHIVYQTTDAVLSVMNIVDNTLIIMHDDSDGPKIRLMDVDWNQVLISSKLVKGRLITNNGGIKNISPTLNKGYIVGGEMVLGE